MSSLDGGEQQQGKKGEKGGQLGKRGEQSGVQLGKTDKTEKADGTTGGETTGDETKNQTDEDENLIEDDHDLQMLYSLRRERARRWMNDRDLPRWEELPNEDGEYEEEEMTMTEMEPPSGAEGRTGGSEFITGGAGVSGRVGSKGESSMDLSDYSGMPWPELLPAGEMAVIHGITDSDME